MTTVLSVNAIVPPKGMFDPKVMLDMLDKAYADEAQAVVLDYQETTKTWADKPEFKIRVKSDPPARDVYTEDEIYKYIDLGTRVKYATMSRDFRAKTMPGVIGSFTGRGHLLYVDRRRPRPGIKAREFTKAIQARSRTRMKDRVSKAIAAADAAWRRR